MDTSQNMIIIKGEFKTASIEECVFDKDSNKYTIRFKNNPTTYSYRKENVLWLKEPIELNPRDHQLIRVKTRTSIPREAVNKIWEFKHYMHHYWCVRTNQSEDEEFDQRSLIVLKSCLVDIEARSVFSYLKETASISELKTEDETNILRNLYDRIDFVEQKTALATYLNPKKSITKNKLNNAAYIFPFGCNSSQQKAVKRAFESQFSIIQGPPGTGKTQTILNIIANILINKGKTILVVSNNNAAILNVLDKMKSYNLGFLVAMLGCTENKQDFIRRQSEKRIPEDIVNWNTEPIDIREIERINSRLEKVFYCQERLAQLKEEKAQLKIERTHFFKENNQVPNELPIKNILDSHSLFEMWNRLETIGSNGPSNLWDRLKWFIYKLKVYFKHGIDTKHLNTESIKETILSLQSIYYSVREKEINEEEKRLNEELALHDGESLSKKLTVSSKKYLLQRLFKQYGGEYKRQIFSEDDIWKKSENILQEYPVILSTTFSARSSLRNIIYDYVIMDEASQVAIETGALALSVGKNVVVVGDSMQLPNVQTLQTNIILDNLFQKFKIDIGYNSSKYSFLESVKHIIKECPTTLLREHYRCHPRIINFCNQKFYGGSLIIMTNNETSDIPLQVIRTVPGNHARGHINEREAEVIIKEVLPHMDINETGIIAAYNDQVNFLSSKIGGNTEISTVHKFQGREKDNIIIDFVDNQPTDFSDNANLMNVAVSRAKKQLCLVVTGNDLPQDSNIADLVEYIIYNNGIVTESKIKSIFDLLYKNQNEELLKFLNKQNKISEFASENLTYNTIKEVLNEDKFLYMDVVFGYPMNHLIRDYSLLNDEEINFAKSPFAHIDFIIYNKVQKKPILAIETNGHAFHYGKHTEAQATRDRIKENILLKYNIDMCSLKTTGSNENKKIRDKLIEIVGT